MKHAALGFRAHSGWTSLVAISLEEGPPLVLLRERPHLVKTFTYEFRQPYHTAAKRAPAEAHGFISRLRVEARGLSYRVVHSVQMNLQKQGYELKCCSLLLASGKPLPGLPKILASHALIHAAAENFSAKHSSTQASAVALSYSLLRRANYSQGPCAIFTCNLMNFAVALPISATLLVPRGHKTKSSLRLSLGFHFCRTASSRARDSITTSCSYVLPSIRRAPKENLSKCIRASPCCFQALFFEVMAEKADQRCSIS